jgi:hypothetical protein
VPSNFDAAAAWALELGYSGPFALAVDDTKCVAALRTYQDGGKWYLGGMHGAVKMFTSYDELADNANIARSDLADKVHFISMSLYVRGEINRKSRSAHGYWFARFREYHQN